MNGPMPVRISGYPNFQLKSVFKVLNVKKLFTSAYLCVKMYAVGNGIYQINSNLFYQNPIFFGLGDGKFPLTGLKPIFLRRSYITWQEKFSLWKLCCAMPTSP